MDSGTVFEQIPAFVLLGIMVLLQFVPPEYRMYLLGAGIITVLAFISGTEYIFRITASKYLYICITVRPSNQVLHAFFTESMGGIHSREIDTRLHIYETPLTLGLPLKNRGFKDVRQMVIEHEYPFEKRFIAFPG